MLQVLVAFLRVVCAAIIIVLAFSARADAIPVFANGQAVSCTLCHTTFPGMTPYGMMTMMTNFQNLDQKKQERALPIAVRSQVLSLFGGGGRSQTMVKTLSVLGGGFIGKNFTWYGEQPIVDSGMPGVTEQLWVSWNGLLHGTNSLQAGKAHTWFPFMPAHGWTLNDYLLATQDSGQNTFEPASSRWGATFNGMSNEFMYGLSYTTSVGSLQRAFDFNKADGNRVLDFNLSYGGMSQPWTVGIVGMRGTAPLLDTNGAFTDLDTFTREGVYYSYQTSKWFLQAMYYHGYDNQPDIGSAGAPFNGAMLEIQRDLNPRDHIIARYDIGSSDTLNRHYIVGYAHNFLPNLKATIEAAVSPGSRGAMALALDYAGPWQSGKRVRMNAKSVAISDDVATPAASASAASAPPAMGSPTGDVNNGAKLVQANGCAGCHGVNLMGGAGAIGPKLFGIEHSRSSDQIADFIKNPRAPMPNFGLRTDQINDIVAYLSGLDGGTNSSKPVVTFNPSPPVDVTTLSIRFPGELPKSAVALPIMQMGKSTMQTRAVTLLPSASDPHVMTGKVVFSMGGPWTIRIQYDGQTLDVPLTVGT